MKIEPETLRELGKLSYTIAAAWAIFGIIQPFFSNQISISKAAIAGVGFTLFLILGIILLNEGSKRDDKR